jgi:nucleotide-binding universal stress UspA family protein
MFKHLLVPLDGSQLSDLAVDRAISFAKEASAQITFFFAKPDYPIAFYGEGALIDPATPEQFAGMAEAQAQEILRAAQTKAQSQGVTSSVLSLTNSAPWEGIVSAAQQVGADLIFMASHGRHGFSGLLLGSETQKVLTHSKIPVLVYR